MVFNNHGVVALLCDMQKECKGWADRGECTKMKSYMLEHCRPACGACKPKGARPKTDQDELITVEALSTEIGKTAVPASALTHVTSTTEQTPPAEPSPHSPAQATKAADAAETPAKQQQPPAADEIDMRKRFRQSTLGFAALIKRYAV